MKTHLLLIILNFLLCQIIMAQPQKNIQQWAKDHKGDIDAHQIVEHTESSKSSSGIVYSNEYTFDHDRTGYTSSAALGPDKFIIAFRDSLNHGNLILGKIIGDTVIFSQKYVFNSDYVGYFSAIGMDSNRFVISWCERYGPGVGPYPIKSIVGIVNDTIITLGPVSEYGSASHWISTARLDSTHFILVSEILSSGGGAILCEIIGNTVSYGIPYEFDPDLNSSYFTAALNDKKFVVVFNDGNYSSSPGKAIIGTINGGSISFGDEYTFCTDAAYFRITNLDTNSFVITYPHHTSGGDMGTACIGIAHGDSISFGNKFVFGQVTNYFYKPLRLDSEHFLVTSSSFYDSIPHGDSFIGSVLGDSVSYSPSYWFNSDYCSNISSDLLDENRFFVAYRESYTTADKGCVVIGSYFDHIETKIDSIEICSGSISIPIEVQYLYEANESYIKLDYDTSILSYKGYQDFSSSIPADSLNISEHEGIIEVFWHTPSAVNIDSDTLVELLFNTNDTYTQVSTTLSFNDTVSYYYDTNGLKLDTEFFDGQIIINPIPDPFIFVIAPDSVCQGAQNVFYGILPIQNADSIVWELIPPGAGTIIGEGESIYINYAPAYYGEAYITGYGVNACGPGDAATYLTYVIGPPVAEAGPSAIICQNTNHTLSGYALNYSISVWITIGDGSFDDAFLLNATYTPGPDDIQNGDVYLVLYACAIHPCFGVDPDTMLLTIIRLPDQPQTPTGPASIIIEPNLTTEYFTNSVANTNWYQWHLNPGEAGLIIAIDTSATIQWNEAFSGSIAYLNVEAVNNCGAVSSDSLIINISPVGIKEKNSLPDITIAPNPSIGFFNIYINRIEDDIKLSVVNSEGNVILQQIIHNPNNQNTYKLDISNEPSGVYYLKFSNQNYSITKKVIVKAHP